MGNEEDEYHRFQEIWKVSSGRGKIERAEEDCDQIHLIKSVNSQVVNKPFLVRKPVLKNSH